MPKVKIERYDEFQEMIPVDVNVTRIGTLEAKRIENIGKVNGVKLEVFFVPNVERYILFGTNKNGTRWHFLTVEEVDHTFRPLDIRTIKRVEQIFFWNKNTKRFFVELREKQKEAREMSKRKDMEEFNYIGTHAKRLFQRLGRVLGYNAGKSNLPY